MSYYVSSETFNLYGPTHSLTHSITRSPVQVSRIGLHACSLVLGIPCASHLNNTSALLTLACNVSGAISNADVGLLGYELEKTCVKHVVFNPPRKAEGVGCVPTTSSNYVLSFVRQIIISSCFTDVT